MEWAQKIVDGTGDTAIWLRSVILGEWEDNRSLSQIITDALTGFVPGVGSIITLRDLLAVIVTPVHFGQSSFRTMAGNSVQEPLLRKAGTVMGAMSK